MTPIRFATAMTVLLVCTSVASAQSIPLAGWARDPGVKRWISYQIIGPRNHPLPIVYISTQSFKRMMDEDLIVLPAKRYDIISSYTQARLSHADCPGERPRGDVWYSVKIALHDKKHSATCVLPQASACSHLSGVLKLSGIELSATERRPIANFMAEIECESTRVDGAK
jgi:hypothetical protein